MPYRVRTRIANTPGDGGLFVLDPDKPAMIGRSAPVDIPLGLPEVSSRHAQLTFDKAQGVYLLEDLNSKQGTYVNSNPLAPNMPLALKSGDVVQIGRAFLLFESYGMMAPADATMMGDDLEAFATQSGHGVGGETVMATMLGFPEEEGEAKKAAEETALGPPPAEEKPPEPVVSTPPPPTRGGEKRTLTQEVQEILLARVDLAKIVRQASDDQHAREIVRQQIVYVINEMWRNGRIREDEIGRLEKASFDDILGFGPIQDLMDDPAVSEVMVNAPDQIYFERAGKIQLCQRAFQNEEHVQQVLRRLLRDSQRRVDEANPIVNATVYGGSRLNAVLPPIALRGTTITIRKFHHNLGVNDLIKYGTLTKGMATFLELAVKERQNIVVSGGTGSGKTTLLNVLSAFIPENQRIVTVEDTAELSLVQPHVVRLQARPANTEGTGLISIRNLVIESLRMRPDRIIVGECRSGETLDMLQAMNTGHDGSLTTVHSNSAQDAFYRLETMVLLTGLDLPIRAIREQIRSAVNLIVHESRMLDGTRKVTEIIELTALENDQIITQPVFRYNQEGLDDQGRIIGHHQPTGYLPTFLGKMRQQGKEIPPGLFDMQ